MNTEKKKEEKYFFNANIFDDDHIDDEPEIPPPPVFSEQELDAAKKQAFQEGRAQGLKESEQSLLKQALLTVEKIKVEMTQLFTAEHERERLYEYESLRLCLQIFEKLFPYYSQHYGFDELKQAMATILKKQQGQQKIIIFVAPSMVEIIDNHLKSVKSAETLQEIVIKGEESLPPGACRLNWEEGGGFRNPEMVAAEIRVMIEQMLAGSGSKGHDSEGPAPAAQVPKVEKADER